MACYNYNPSACSARAADDVRDWPDTCGACAMSRHAHLRGTARRSAGQRARATGISLMDAMNDYYPVTTAQRRTCFNV
ncbi:hypothetical protein J6590_004625 [Homalodisca vitripennis]|nr:hypothetical protein J6590_004625 [Homalodisca vitripennis]